jgi:uncharacterized protein (DUF362 family)
VNKSNKKTSVVLLKGNKPTITTNHALELIDSQIDIKSKDKVLIKPNCVRPVSPSTGVTTDSKVVEAIVEFVKRRGSKDITIADGGNPGTNKAFKITGLTELADRHDLELVNLNKDEWEEVEIPNGTALKKVKIAKTVRNSTCIINVPKLKIHHMAQVTLSLKNLMGTIVDHKGKVMHYKLDEKLVDLASIFTPKLNVIDGFIGAEMDEVMGRPVPMNVVLAGVDMVATDVVGSAIMGLDPQDVRHIQMASLKGFGIGDLNEIEVLGDSISSVKKYFSQELSDKKLESYGLSRPLSEDDIDKMHRQFFSRDPHVAQLYKE